MENRLKRCSPREDATPGKEDVMGCLYRRGKNYWIKYYRNGKPIIEFTRTDKKEVATRLLKGREGEISKGETRDQFR